MIINLKREISGEEIIDILMTVVRLDNVLKGSKWSLEIFTHKNDKAIAIKPEGGTDIDLGHVKCYYPNSLRIFPERKLGKVSRLFFRYILRKVKDDLAIFTEKMYPDQYYKQIIIIVEKLEMEYQKVDFSKIESGDLPPNFKRIILAFERKFNS